MAWYDDVAAAELWLKHGAKIDARESIDDLFIGAFQWKRYHFAYWLLARGADVNAAEQLSGNTALMIAVKRKDEENIRRLTKAGADPNRNNKKGESARSIAQTKGPKKLLNLL